MNDNEHDEAIIANRCYNSMKAGELLYMNMSNYVYFDVAGQSTDRTCPMPASQALEYACIMAQKWQDFDDGDCSNAIEYMDRVYPGWSEVEE